MKEGAKSNVATLRHSSALIAALLCGLIALVPQVNAVDFGAPVWTNRYDGDGRLDDTAYAIAVDANGNVFVTGKSRAESLGNDFTTIAYSAEGVPLWTNHFNGPRGAGDEAHAIAVDKNGNVFVAGYLDNGANYDYGTIAYSGLGIPLWTNRYEGPGNGDDIVTAMVVDTNGNVFVTGYSNNGTNNDYLTVGYSNLGVPLWTNRYDGLENGDDMAIAIGVDKNGNVFVTGQSFASNSYDYATLAYSRAGVPLWTNWYDGLINSYDSARAMVVDRNGTVIVTGQSAGNDSVVDYATVAYSGTGMPLWTNRHNGPGNSWDLATAITADANGNVFVTGYSETGIGDPFNYDFGTVAYSSLGVPLWTNFYDGPGNGSDQPNAICVDAQGNVFVTGTGIATVAYSGAGTPLWTNRYAGIGSAHEATAMAIDRYGNLLVTGYSRNATNRDYVTIKYAGFNSAPLTLMQATAENGQFHFLFSAKSSHSYTIEFRDILDTNNWVTLTNIPAQPTATNIAVINSITNAARFFRVRTP